MATGRSEAYGRPVGVGAGNGCVRESSTHCGMGSLTSHTCPIGQSVPQAVALTRSQSPVLGLQKVPPGQSVKHLPEARFAAPTPPATTTVLAIAVAPTAVAPAQPVPRSPASKAMPRRLMS